MEKLELIRLEGSVIIASETKKVRSNRLLWYGQATRRYESHITRRPLCIKLMDVGIGDFSYS